MTRLVLLVALLAGCNPGPDIDASQQTYLIYDWNAEERSYELHPGTIKTLEDPRRINGSVAELRGGGSLDVALGEPQGPEEWEDAIRVRGDAPPSAEYFIEDGVVVPYDFDTLLMVTLYHHLERADEFFRSHGVESVGRLPVYYYTQFAVFGFQLPLITDNAAYISTLDAFLIPPTVRLIDDVPLSANRGVIVHEYSHAVFNRLVWGGAKVPPPTFDDRYAEVAAPLRSRDEAMADVFGALATGDSNFIAPSISEEEFGIDRDLAKERIWEGELADRIADEGLTNPYLLGSVIASAIWAMRDDLGDDMLAETTVAALRAIANPGPNFELSMFLNAWVDAAPADDRPAACELFTARFPPIADDLCIR